MPQRIISADSTVLNSIQLCARRTQYAFYYHFDEENKKWSGINPPEKAEALERGDLMHTLLEIYYSCIGGCVSPKSKTWKLIIEKLGITPPEERWRPETAVQLALDVAPLYASTMNLEVPEVEETVFQFKEYTTHFYHDGWNPLAVEAVGSKILYEDEDLKMIYNFKIDLIAEKGNIIAPWDHKTSKRRQNPSSLSNQFMGYAWGMGMEHIVVNKIGYQKTLKPTERFERHILTYSLPRLEEWRKNTVWWLKMLDYHLSEQEFPMNLTSCDKYSGCIYAGICEKDQESRDWIIQRDFKKAESWDVAKELEQK